MTMRLGRLSTFALLAIVVPAAIVAALGFVSIRQWERSPTTRTVDTHVLRLRKKRESDPDHPAWILTVHAQGYRFATG